ncbi:extracellular solute-binding protein, partial [Candidatus Gracilibacteria bacterium]|nr:extracellular solute-binding protein [Candidatus Gracilibacteria bacterium]
MAQGQLLDLTPYLEQLGPTLDFIGEDGLKKGQFDGTTYAIAKAPFAPQFTYWVRQDWLDALELVVPTTPDELLAVAEAFTSQDPDGNGKNDTYGITGASFSNPPYINNIYSPIFGAFGVGNPGSFYLKDGQLSNGFSDPAMIEAITFIQQLAAAGVVDPDLAANTGSQWRDKAFQGQFGIVYAGWPDMTNQVRVDEYKAVNPNAVWTQMAPLTGPGGQTIGILD